MKQIDSNYFVSEQITVDDLQNINAQGIKSIICNRPDNEAEDQTNYSDIEEAANKLGMEICFIPVDRNGINNDHIHFFNEAFKKMQHPILAYCRSGMRSTTIWALSNPDKQDPVEIINKANNAGYDISSFRDRISAED